MRKYLIVLSLLIISCSSFAGDISVVGLVGQWQYDMFVNNANVEGSATTFGAQAKLSYPVGGQLAIGVDAIVNILKGKAEGSPYLNSGNDIFAGATVQYNLPFEGGTAYAAAGGGMRAFKLEVGETGEQLNTRQYKVSGALLGGGFTYQASPTMRVVGDARFLLPLSAMQEMSDQGFDAEEKAEGGLLSLSVGAQLKIAENMFLDARGRFSKEDFKGPIGAEKISGTSFGAAAGVQFLF